MLVLLIKLHTHFVDEETWFLEKLKCNMLFGAKVVLSNPKLSIRNLEYQGRCSAARPQDIQKSLQVWRQMLGRVTCVPEDTVPLLLLFPERVSIGWSCPSKVPFLGSIEPHREWQGLPEQSRTPWGTCKVGAMRDGDSARNWNCWACVSGSDSHPFS